jgi:hypothetical protein
MAMTGLRSMVGALQRWSRFILYGSMAFVLVVGGVYALHFGDRVRFYDEGDYLAIAQNLAHGRGFSIYGTTPSAFRAPAFPVLLGVARVIGIPVTEARMLNVGLLTLSVWLAWHLASRIAGPAAAAITAALTALYPLAFFTASTFYPETLATTLLLAAVLCAVVADDTRPCARANWILGASGLLFALLFLAVPSFIAAAVITVAWYLWRHRTSAIAGLAWFVVLFAIPVVIWTVRNEVEMHAFVPATTGSGVNLLLGNSAHTGGDTGVYADISQYTRIGKQRRYDEVALDHYYRSTALDYMKDHPARILGLWVEKSVNYFNPANRLATGSESSSSRNLVAAVTYFPLLLLLLYRLFLALRRRLPLARAEVLLVAIYFLMAPTMGIFFTRSRFRVPCDELLLVLVGVGIVKYALLDSVRTVNAT